MTDPGVREDDPAAGLISALAANGFPRMPAAVLMALVTSEDDALTADQLAERLGASAAAISGAVRFLESLNVVLRHRRAGSRRFEYELSSHDWFTESIANFELYDVLARMADDTAGRLGPKGAQRIGEMGDFFRFIRARMATVLHEWNTQRSAPAPEDDSPQQG